ncbi:sodium:solute symporter family protein [Rossellomorea aquimaris]|jgi:solute:Na+ symporter, SSS family|uniref:Sodium:pantothenate symporter n=1 Tax=Rossellomorea aquimaris TaxID=189382 RepID=A0A1J6WLN9_9BACI|nr:sodium:solute symporter family protein [Rossellomorea aquimaris]OIU72728.1 sodium:pantothenate symporter [Rossellomorea aquimaris]
MDLTFAGMDGIIILTAFAVIMLVIGYFSGRGEKDLHHSLSGYYLAGRNLGFIALFFTLYATQYSGNTIVGYAPSAYRTGFSWLQSISFMTIIIGIYLLFAPRLYVIAKRKNFVTPTDWIEHRFKSKAVTLLSIFLMLWGLGNYLLEQLVAIGQAVSGMTGGTVPYQVAVLVFIFVMLAYEWMGGMKAVAFTDVMQGLVLMVGIIVFLIGGLYLVGGNFADVTRYINEMEPAKTAVPPMDVSINWFSMLLLVGLGASIYPHAVQRIYSAQSEKTLKKSFSRMAWMPPITTGLVFVIGIIAIMLYPGLDTRGSEQIVGFMANDIAAINPFFYWMMIIFFGGIVAAIVSTADSVLLSFSSMLSNDVYGKFINPGASEHKKVMVGKIGGIIAVFLLLWIAWNPPGTLYEIFVLKFELLVQVFPAFVLGLYWKRLDKHSVFWGMLIGALLAGFLTFTGHKTVYGIHGGVVGLALNFLICVAGSLLVPVSKKSSVIEDEPMSLKMKA